MHLEITRVLPTPAASDSQTKASTKSSAAAPTAGTEAAADSFLEAFKAEENRNRKPQPRQTPPSKDGETPEQSSVGEHVQHDTTSTETDVKKEVEAVTSAGASDAPVKTRARGDAPPSAEGEGVVTMRVDTSLAEKKSRPDSVLITPQAKEKTAPAPTAAKALPLKTTATSEVSATPSPSPSGSTRETTSEASSRTAQPQGINDTEAVQTAAGAPEQVARPQDDRLSDAPRNSPPSSQDEVSRMLSNRSVASAETTDKWPTSSEKGRPGSNAEPHAAQPRPQPTVTLSEAAFSTQARQVNTQKKTVSDTEIAPRAKQPSGAPTVSQSGVGEPSAPVAPQNLEVRLTPAHPESNASPAAFASQKAQIGPAGPISQPPVMAGLPQPTEAVPPQGETLPPSSLQSQGRASPVGLAKEPAGVSMPLQTPWVTDLGPVRIERREIGDATPKFADAVMPPKQEMTGQLAASGTAEIKVSKGEATASGSGVKALIDTVGTPPNPVRPHTTLETKPVGIDQQLPEAIADASNPEDVQRARVENPSSLQASGLGHGAPNAALSVQAGLSTTAIPFVPVNTDKLDMFEELTLGVSASSPESSASKADFIAAATHRPTSTAHAILAQLQMAVPKTPGDSTEILLSPEELGRVRMTLSGSEGVGTVFLQVERPETLDLIRRNIEQMRAELADAGWENVSFSFSQDGSNTSDTSDEGAGTGSHQRAPSQADTSDAAGPASSRTNTSSSGLDLRL